MRPIVIVTDDETFAHDLASRAPSVEWLCVRWRNALGSRLASSSRTMIVDLRTRPATAPVVSTRDPRWCGVRIIAIAELTRCAVYSIARVQPDVVVFPDDLSTALNIERLLKGDWPCRESTALEASVLGPLAHYLDDTAYRLVRVALQPGRPVRSVKELAAFAEVTVWRAANVWSACAVRERLPLKDFVRWVLLLRVADMLEQGATREQTALTLGISVKTLHRLLARARRYAPASVSLVPAIRSAWMAQCTTTRASAPRDDAIATTPKATSSVVCGAAHLGHQTEHLGGRRLHERFPTLFTATGTARG